MFKEFPKLLQDSGLSKRAARNGSGIEYISRALFSMAAAEVLRLAGGLVVPIEGRKGKEPDDYKVLINEMVQISDGIFLPDWIEASWVNDEHREIRIEFKYQEKVYQTIDDVFGLAASSTWFLLSPIRIIHLINRALAEGGREDRFHIVCTVNEFSHRKDHSIIFLNPSQRNRILETEALILPNVEGEINVWTESQTEASLLSLIGFGLLPALDQDELEALKSKILQEGVSDPVSILCQFPELIYSFDVEYINNRAETEKAYREIIGHFAELSAGLFHPEKVKLTIVEPLSDNRQRDREITLFFEVQGVQYSKVLVDFNDWVDISFIETINQSLIEHEIMKAFYCVDTGDQSALIVFLERDMAKKVNESGVLSLRQ